MTVRDRHDVDSSVFVHQVNLTHPLDTLAVGQKLLMVNWNPMERLLMLMM